MDYAKLASELLRAQRGRRSQAAWSRWLGFKSNVAYAWESGRAFPTAAEYLAIWARRGVDLHAAYQRFYQRQPAWLAATAPDSVAGVASFLDDLRGRTRLIDLARAMEASRFAVSRWLSGESEVRLPQFLALLQATSLRVLDYVSLFVEPSKLPSARVAWKRLEAARGAAYSMPWSQLVLRALELSAYRRLRRHHPGWIARTVGISAELETSMIEFLLETGQVVLRAGHYEPVEVFATDTRADPESAWKARAFWSRLGLERLEARSEGTYWYNVIGVSEADWRRINQLQASYFREIRTIVAASQPVERVALMNLQLIPMNPAWS